MRPSTAVCRLFAALTTVGAALAAARLPLYAQADIATIQIVDVDTTHFPDVTVQARILDTAGMPVPSLPPDALVLTEGEAERPFEYQSIDAGVQVALVADIGAGNGAAGATGAARGDEIRGLMNRTIDAMRPSDMAMVLLVEPDGVSLPQPMTSDKQALYNATGQIRVMPGVTALTNGPAGVVQALDELARLQDGHQPQAVIYLSSGVQSTAPISYEEAESLAASLGIPVHTVLCNDKDNGAGYGLARIAQNTGGVYTFYTTETSLTPILDQLAQQRRQFVFTFRSSLSTSGERTVALAARHSGPAGPRAEAIYVVEVLPPVVTIDQPTGGTEYVRRAATPQQVLDTVQPTSATVAAHVEWPDGHPRGLSTAQLLVNGDMHGAPQSDPGTELLFAWDLRPYRDLGQNNVQIQVQVTDELGFLAVSPPMLVLVTVDVPVVPAPEEQGCAAATDLIGRIVCYVNSLAGITALVIAIPTLILAMLAWRNRHQISTTIVQAGEQVTEAMARITRPIDNGRDASAYLFVLHGDPYLVGKRFPIYAGTVTPIGRDRSQVEIVFPDEENSVISRKHCEIRQEGNGFMLRDFASTYGTYLNGVRLPELAIEPLHHGDEIALGPIERGGILMRFEVPLLDEDMPDDVRATQPAPE